MRRSILKRWGLFTATLLCVTFSSITLLQHQTIYISTSNKAEIPQIFCGIHRYFVFPSLHSQVPAPSWPSSPPPVSTPSPSRSTSPSPLPSTTPSQSMPDSTSPTPIPLYNPSPSKSPSITPTPFAIFINHSIYGTRERKPLWPYVIDTTINTPVTFRLDNIIHKQLGPASSLNFTTPEYGSIQFADNDNLIYTPSKWYTGIDKFRCFGMDTNGILFEEVVYVRIRIGVVLNKPLMIVPENYLFSELSLNASNEMKQDLFRIQHQKVFPQHDTWLNRRYNTCAVVGNGGSLRGRKRGPEIDNHDVVVRINVAPFSSYAADVGSKLTIGVVNGGHFGSCWKGSLKNPQYEILGQATFPIHLNYQLCQDNYRNMTFTPMSYLFIDLVDSILNEYHRVKFNGTDRKYRSTGMLAVTAMAMICDHVSLYGFERGPNMENFYYDAAVNVEREWNGHSYEAEKAYFRDLVKGTGIFEPFLELYDLYTSFSYVVD